MSRARDLADFIGSGSTPSGILADGVIAFSEVSSKPTTVAGYGITDSFDGAYGSLTGAPTLAAVATSGAASDVSGLATVATTGAAANVSGLATVAISGAYSDVIGTPSLGTAAALNVGTGANNIPQLDSNGNLPALDGSSLTGIQGFSYAATLAFGDY